MQFANFPVMQPSSLNCGFVNFKTSAARDVLPSFQWPIRCKSIFNQICGTLFGTPPPQPETSDGLGVHPQTSQKTQEAYL